MGLDNIQILLDLFDLKQEEISHVINKLCFNSVLNEWEQRCKLGVLQQFIYTHE